MTIVYVIILVWSVVQFLFLVLKLANIIKWDWEWVYAPIWLAATLALFVGTLLLAGWLMCVVLFKVLVLLI